MDSTLDDRIDLLKADIEICEEVEVRWGAMKKGYKDELRALEKLKGEGV